MVMREDKAPAASAAGFVRRDSIPHQRNLIIESGFGKRAFIAIYRKTYYFLKLIPRLYTLRNHYFIKFFL